MGRTEKNLLIAVLLGACTIGSFYLTGRSLSRAYVLENMTGRLIFSSAAYVDPTGHSERFLLDDRPDTAIPDLNAPARRSSYTPAVRSAPETGISRHSSDNPRWPWSLQRPFVQLQVGLTHSAGHPPRPNPLRAMYVWSGNQSSPSEFRQSARPRTIRLIFFRQQIVDLDREYRLPGEPEYWTQRSFHLKDEAGQQTIFLDFLEPPPPSPGFPREVQQIWLRLEILDYYPGRDPARRDWIALSELAFEFQNQALSRRR